MRYKDIYYTYPQLLFKPHNIEIEDGLTNLRMFGNGHKINDWRNFWVVLKEIIPHEIPKNKRAWQALHDKWIGTRIL